MWSLHLFFQSCLILLLLLAPLAEGFTSVSISGRHTRQSRLLRPSATREETDISSVHKDTEGVVVDEALQPYRGEQPKEALPDIFVPNVMPDGIDEELLWVPQTDTVSFRPLCFCTSGGYYVNLLRVKGAGVLSRHRHPGPVHGHVLKGEWRYLEHDWVAKEGSYVFEPPGEIHTLVVPEGVEEMITMFHVTGSLLYCDQDGNVVGADDVFTKLELAKKHYAAVGLGEDFVQQFVR